MAHFLSWRLQLQVLFKPSPCANPERSAARGNADPDKEILTFGRAGI
jgi:hypothetical protein